MGAPAGKDTVFQERYPGSLARDGYSGQSGKLFVLNMDWFLYGRNDKPKTKPIQIPFPGNTFPNPLIG